MDGNGCLFATSLKVLTAPKLEDAGIYVHFIFNVHYYMLTTYQQLPVFLVPSLNPFWEWWIFTAWFFGTTNGSPKLEGWTSQRWQCLPPFVVLLQGDGVAYLNSLQFAPLKSRPSGRAPIKGKVIFQLQLHPVSGANSLLVLGMVKKKLEGREQQLLLNWSFLNFRLRHGRVLPICSLHGGATKNLEKYKDHKK